MSWRQQWESCEGSRAASNGLGGISGPATEALSLPPQNQRLPLSPRGTFTGAGGPDPSGTTAQSQLPPSASQTAAGGGGEGGGHPRESSCDFCLGQIPRGPLQSSLCPQQLGFLPALGTRCCSGLVRCSADKVLGKQTPAALGAGISSCCAAFFGQLLRGERACSCLSRENPGWHLLGAVLLHLGQAVLGSGGA